MVDVALLRKAGGQLRRWDDDPTNSDKTAWHNVLALYGDGNWQSRPKFANAAASVPDCTGVPGTYTVEIHELRVWASLGYVLTAAGVQDLAGTTLDALAFARWRLVEPDGVGGYTPYDGYGDGPGGGADTGHLPSSGLIVHASPSPAFQNIQIPNWPANHTGPVHGLFWQHGSQAFSMTYYRDFRSNEMPDGVPLVLAAGKKLNVQMKIVGSSTGVDLLFNRSPDPAPDSGIATNFGYEYDVVLRGKEIRP